MVSAGALALSILNTCMQVSNNRVKLRIIPMIGYYDDKVKQWAVSAIPFPDMIKAIENKKHRLCVQVTNLSSFAVTIQKLGFGKCKLLQNSISVPLPTVMKRTGCWPLKLESRESELLTLETGVNIPIDELDKNCAYVVTECGHEAYGTSHVFDAYVELLKKQKN